MLHHAGRETAIRRGGECFDAVPLHDSTMNGPHSRDAVGVGVGVGVSVAIPCSAVRATNELVGSIDFAAKITKSMAVMTVRAPLPNTNTNTNTNTNLDGDVLFVARDGWTSSVVDALLGVAITGVAVRVEGRSEQLADDPEHSCIHPESVMITVLCEALLPDGGSSVEHVFVPDKAKPSVAAPTGQQPTALAMAAAVVVAKVPTAPSIRRDTAVVVAKVPMAPAIRRAAAVVAAKVPPENNSRSPSPGHQTAAMLTEPPRAKATATAAAAATGKVPKERGSGASRRNSSKSSKFAKFLVDVFGRKRLRAGTGVVDVAGGNGDLAICLTTIHRIPCTVVDPNLRPVNLQHPAV